MKSLIEDADEFANKQIAALEKRVVKEAIQRFIEVSRVTIKKEAEFRNGLN